MTVDLHSLRPDLAAVEAEFHPARRAALLASVFDRAAPQTTARAATLASLAPARRRRLNRRRRLALVAASAVLLAGFGSVSGPMLSSRSGSDLSPVLGQLAAAAGLDDLARQAALKTTPFDVGPDQYLAVVTVDQQSGKSATRHESYTMADGWTWRQDTDRGRRTWYLYSASNQLDVQNLPTEPDRLEAALRKQELGTRSDEQGLFKLIGEIAGSGSAPAAVRTASLEILAEMAERPPVAVSNSRGGSTIPAVTALEGRIAGQPATGARFTDGTRPGDEVTYWFDPTTAELLRTDQHLPDDGTFVSEVRSRTVVDNLPDPIKNKLGTDKVEKIER